MIVRLVLSRVVSFSETTVNRGSVLLLSSRYFDNERHFPYADTPPSSSAFSCANSYYDAKGNPTGLHFSFLKDVQWQNRWCNFMKR